MSTGTGRLTGIGGLGCECSYALDAYRRWIRGFPLAVSAHRHWMPASCGCLLVVRADAPDACGEWMPVGTGCLELLDADAHWMPLALGASRR